MPPGVIAPQSASTAATLPIKAVAPVDVGHGERAADVPGDAPRSPPARARDGTQVVHHRLLA
jgi:hypothetical protein